jgi:hypothetical protein
VHARARTCVCACVWVGGLERVSAREEELWEDICIRL